MRYSELTEDAPPKEIQSLIQSTALSLIATGREQVHTQNLVNEIKKRTGIDVPYGVLMDILNAMPFVQDANSDMITFGSQDTEGNTEEESSEQQVQDMATKAASKDI